MKRGWTAVHLASNNCNVECLALLLANGATVNVQNNVRYF